MTTLERITQVVLKYNLGRIGPIQAITLIRSILLDKAND